MGQECGQCSAGMTHPCSTWCQLSHLSWGWGIQNYLTHRAEASAKIAQTAGGNLLIIAACMLKCLVFLCWLLLWSSLFSSIWDMFLFSNLFWSCIHRAIFLQNKKLSVHFRPRPRIVMLSFLPLSIGKASHKISPDSPQKGKQPLLWKKWHMHRGKGEIILAISADNLP